MASETRWWDRRAPYQREIIWSAAFSLSILVVLVAVTLILWPAFLTDPEMLVLGSAVGDVVGLALAAGGLYFGYRMEDRREGRGRRV